MATYLTITLMISAICAIAMLFLTQAPARVRFYLCILLLTSWLLPWQHIQLDIEKHNFILPINSVSEFTQLRLIAPEQHYQMGSNQAETGFSLPFHWIWKIAFMFGLALFAKDVVSYRKQHKQWIENSVKDNEVWDLVKLAPKRCDIRRLDKHIPGMATGLFRPIIWLDSHQLNEDKIRTIVLHEFTHIRQYDTFWLWVINFVQRLFWWNPIIFYTANVARNQMELSCDEQCKNQFPENSYQQHLIELTLEVNAQQYVNPMPTALPMSGSKAFNLTRINKLNKEYKMKKRYAAVVVTALSLIGWVGVSNARVNISSHVHQINNETLDSIYTAWNDGDFESVLQQLINAESNIESYSASEQAKIWRLHVIYLLENNPKDIDALPFLDKMVALSEQINQQDALDDLSFAMSIATSLDRSEKQLDYSEKWFALADDSIDKTRTLFLTAISYLQLGDDENATNSLTELINIEDAQGIQPKKDNLALLFQSYMGQKNYSEAVKIQERIVLLYPSDEGEELLEHIRHLI